jgi:hypothetical protein
MEGHECGLLATSYSAATLFLESQRYGAFDSTGDWGREINPQDTDHQSKTHECVPHSVPQAPKRVLDRGLHGLPCPPMPPNLQKLVHLRELLDCGSSRL